MRIKNTILVAASAAAVAGVAGGGYIAQHALASKDPAERAQSVTVAAAAAPVELLLPSLLQNAACDLEAIPDLSVDLDSRVADAAADTLFARALDPAGAVDQAGAVSQAIAMSSDPSSVTAVAAAKVPFSIGGPILNDSQHPLVAPSRCVWMVTVVGTYTPDSARPGAQITSAPGYTVALDAASGEVIDFQAGLLAPSLITGIGL